MTVQIDIDEKLWEEAETLAKNLDINRTEIFQDTLREVLEKLKIAEKERRAVEAYRKNPIQPDEFEVEEEQIEEAWKDL